MINKKNFERLINKNNISKLNFDQVKLINESGEYVGLFKINDALNKAIEVNLDLVIVNNENDPPICKLLNYNQMRYNQKRKKKQQKKTSSLNKLKELRFHVNINNNDYQYKIDRIIEFLSKGYRVKVSLIFRGREIKLHNRDENSFISRLSNDIANFGITEGEPVAVGRSIIVIFKSIIKK